MRRLACLLVASLVGGTIAPVAARKAQPDDSQPPWQSLITARDRGRLRDWRQAWIDGLTQARAAGFAITIDREGALLDPDGALNDPELVEGEYRCRTIKLGLSGTLGKAYSATDAVPCRVADRRFELLGGPQRPAGRIWPYDGPRLLFLGSIALADERSSFAYARDPDRDALGLIERVGKARWRLVMPRPQWEAQIAVIEIVPVATL